MPPNFPMELEKAKNLPDIYEIVKKAVYTEFNRKRAGIMLGLADLGEGANAWIGGYHVISSNAIVMNSRPLKYVESNHPELYKPYAFVILLHEYIHSLGVTNERQCRTITYQIVKELFQNHVVTEMAADISKFLPKLRQVKYGWHPGIDSNIYYVRNFDRSSASYVI
jgi:hypothetical protein